MADALSEAHPLLPNANGEVEERKGPKHAPGGGWLHLNDGTGGWVRHSSRGADYVDVWYPEHDMIIEIGNAAKLPRQEEYFVPDLCGTLQIAMIEAKKHADYSEKNQSSVMSDSFSVAQAEAILAISRIQKTIAQRHVDSFNRMVAEKRAQTLLTLRY